MHDEYSPGLDRVGTWRVGFQGLEDSGLVGLRGTTRAEDAQGTPTQSHRSPSVLVYEDNPDKAHNETHSNQSNSI